MCGIFGIIQFNPDSAPDRASLEKSAQLLAHRGPDYQDIYADSATGLVHTRLSLLDPSPRSHQPFWDSRRRYCLVYNGEIYNYRQLREDLADKGITFHTTSDTEVLLEALIHLGPDETVGRLEGMFAFGLYDTQEQSLILARDRFGIKPLYIYKSPEVFIFASEIRSMRPWVRFEPDLLSISSYLSGFAGPTKGFSFYKNIEIVAPGSIVTVGRNKALHRRSFFRMSDLWDQGRHEQLSAMKPRQAVDHIEELLLDSVRMQLAADAPVGALCSGGVDSSVIMAMAARFHNNLAVFHANVVGPDSEYEAAKALADHLKLDLKAVDVTDADFIDMMPEVTLHYGHPFFRHPNSVPFIMVSQLVRDNHVKAVLSGEGSDECYYGYPNMIHDPASSLRRLWNESPYRILRRFARWLLRRKNSVIPPDVTEGIASRYERELENDQIRIFAEQHAHGRITERDLKSFFMLCYHLRTLLHRNDCLGMSAGIEARFPFLDSRLVKAAVNLPYRYKVRFSPFVHEKRHRFLRDKWVIRKIADRYLPKELSRRRKLGFPSQAYLRMNISRDFFDKSLTSELLGFGRRHMEYFFRYADQRMKVRLLHLEVWAHMCLYDLPKDRIIARLRDNITFSSPTA